MSVQSFSSVFARSLQGTPCAVVGLEDEPVPLPVDVWSRPADADDLTMVDLCRGATLDVGCGPGRMTAALAERGTVALGIDVVGEAVAQTVDRGGAALRRDVFSDVPGEGRWGTVLLVDGNVGIGGDPVALLRRVRELLDPRGRVVVEVAAAGVPARTVWAALTCDGLTSSAFRWSVLGLDDVEAVAAAAGLAVLATTRHGARWCVVLEERP